MAEIYIPAATAAKLNGHHPEGTRHQALKDIAIPLIGNGLSPNAVFQTLRDKFPPDVTDAEIQGVVRWAVDKKPTPSGFGRPAPAATPFTPLPSRPAAPQTPPDPVAHTKWWLNGETLTDAILTQSSPIPVPHSPVEQCVLALGTLYSPDECVNIVGKYVLDGEKSRPDGAGKVQTAVEWQRWLAEKGFPVSKAGGWQRMNPCKPVGSGVGGAITDADVTAHRFILLESDKLPLEMQLRFYRRLKLPIAVILSSGGKSAHAWCRVNAPDAAAYEAFATRIIGILKPFGIDGANKNASRLSRLVGAKREIGATGDGQQKLLWMAQPNTEPLAEEALLKLEQQLAVPDIADRPMANVCLSAMDRYQELHANVGKLGIPTGIREFDNHNGGLKGGQMVVVAGATGGGKSTFALNLMNHALLCGHGVALVTLEMDREEIVDMLYAMNGLVNRNVFNTGQFVNEDINRMTTATHRISNYPLWIFDDARLNMSQIGDQICAIRDRIGLVIVDYVQIIAPADAREPREQQVAGIARELRILAKQTKLPMVVLSQLNDEGKLRESRVVAHEAHAVIQVECNEDDTIMEVRVVKGRKIRREKFTMNYRPEYCKIENQPLDYPR